MIIKVCKLEGWNGMFDLSLENTQMQQYPTSSQFSYWLYYFPLFRFDWYTMEYTISSFVSLGHWGLEAYNFFIGEIDWLCPFQACLSG